MLLHLTFYMGAGALIHVIQLPQQALLSTETPHGPQTSCHSSPSLRGKEDPSSVSNTSPMGVWIFVQNKFYINKHGQDVVYLFYTHDPGSILNHAYNSRLKTSSTSYCCLVEE